MFHGQTLIGHIGSDVNAVKRSSAIGFLVALGVLVEIDDETGCNGGANSAGDGGGEEAVGGDRVADVAGGGVGSDDRAWGDGLGGGGGAVGVGEEVDGELDGVVGKGEREKEEESK